MASPAYHLSLVTALDVPLFEISLPSTSPAVTKQPASVPIFKDFVLANMQAMNHPAAPAMLGLGPMARLQMITYAALDSVDDVRWLPGMNSMYLKAITHIDEYTVSCFLTPSDIRIVLLHLNKPEEYHHKFLTEVWDAYIILALNPFFDPEYCQDGGIQNREFEEKVRIAAKRWL